MKRMRSIAIITLLLGMTLIVAAVRLLQEPPVPAGAIQLQNGETVREILLSDWKLTFVEGIVVNGKGENRVIREQGIALAEVLTTEGIADFTQVRVVAADEYFAVVTAEEVAERGRVYFLLPEETSPQLVVFGDKNSKRNVSDVVRLVIE